MTLIIWKAISTLQFIRCHGNKMINSICLLFNHPPKFTYIPSAISDRERIFYPMEAIIGNAAHAPQEGAPAPQEDVPAPMDLLPPPMHAVEDALQYIFHFIMGVRDQDTLK